LRRIFSFSFLHSFYSSFPHRWPLPRYKPGSESLRHQCRILVDPVLTDVHTNWVPFQFHLYRLLKDVQLSLVGGRPVDIFVHPGRSVDITLVGEYKNLVELRVKVKRDGVPILNTHVRLSLGRTISSEAQNTAKAPSFLPSPPAFNSH